MAVTSLTEVFRHVLTRIKRVACREMIRNESSSKSQLSSHPRLHVVLQSGRLYLNHGSSCSPYRGPIPKYGRRSLQKLPCKPRKPSVVERWFDAWNGTLQVGKNLKDVTMHSAR
ncbi:hypothetical protein M404DRAFT_1001551 [Pisolithus tinctorius Marx 270]|uniref:Uncharacterized protein n=1 Tax=Pisolithus tinctorius Marx 270 TaxID=870435 RepID=A0A0C3NQY8_PISTI|nr:hypothetical protein M404DRAFT_1001551 [Pisolithus tinctorius Marx 270]